MNNQEVIFDKLKDNEVVKEILLNQDHVGNLFDMEEALVLATAFKQDHKSRLIVKKNRYEAQQLFQRLSMLEENVLLFVMEESLRVQSIASSPEDREGMIYALTKIVRSDESMLVVCNTAALLRFLPDVEYFKENLIDLKVDQTCSMKELRSHLNQSGYAKVNYVDKPCTYACRGGIIDIFSLEYDYPIRIEFFDTEIESIRFFNEQTQRTIRSIDSVEIGPATDILLTNQQIETIKEAVFEKLEKEKKSLVDDAKDMLIDHVEANMRALENHDTDAYLYRYYSYIPCHSILDYFDGQVVLSSKEEVEKYSKQLNEENISFIQELVQDYKALPKYTMFHDLYVLLKQQDVLEFHEFLDFDHPITSNIFPLEKANQPVLNILQDIGQEKVYFALEKEDKKHIQNILLENDDLKLNVEFIDPIFYEGFVYEDTRVYTKYELFYRSIHRAKYQKTFKDGQILENVLELEKNDYVVHEHYGIGQYLGIVQRVQNNKTKDYLHIVYKGGDELFVPLNQFQLVRKYISKEGVGVPLSQLGSNKWEKTKEKVNQKVEEIAGRLVELYAARNENIGFAFSKDDALQKEFEDAFEYEATPDQIQATEEIKREMEKPKPMDHLLCGDVGFGKTEVAMRCAFKAVSNNKQVAFLCPTTILSMQHYQTLKKRFENVGVNIALVNRFVENSRIKDIQKGLAAGTIDIVVGTHKLLNKNFKYKDLGFLIIDEEQRFGVEHKEKIKEMKNSIDVLVLSATPIPRTLQMSLIGVRTISQLNTPPAQRHPIQTYVMEKKGSVIKEIIQRELSRGGQVFYLYNRISNIYITAKNLQADFKDVGIAVVHGRMDKEEIEDTMVDFANGKYKILVCTSIIETGLDIANANTIIIEDADRFGLSQLYQIRGRVGRRDKIGYCYLMIQPHKELTEVAQKRLKSIKEFTQLGSGYKIAMRDLTIRGAGDMLGASQSGFIDQVGLDMYLELLSNAIARKQGKPIEPKKELKHANVALDGFIPEQFTDNDGDKLEIYQTISKISSLKELNDYQNRIKDLFGKIPKQVKLLFEHKKLDLFVNMPGVKSLKENDTQVTITMNETWTKHCDGVKVFEAMNEISPKIGLRLTNGMIEISIMKKKKYTDLLNKVIQNLQENDYASR